MELRGGSMMALFLTSALLLAVYQVWRAWELKAIERRFGCKSPQRLKQSIFCLGLDYLIDFVKAARSHNVLEHLRTLHEQHRYTFTAHVLGDIRFHTSEPENIKALLSSQFDEFELGAKRHRAFSPLLGDGIFTADGDAWKHSRDLLRPNFTRMLLDDNVVEMEKHFQRFRGHLPADDRAVDLQPLFFQLTMDVSTQFLFGLSSDSLLDESSETWDGFSDAFEDAQWGISLRPRLGRLNDVYTTLRASQEHNGSAAPNQKNGYCFLDELSCQVREKRMLRDHAVNVLVAGRDTTAGLLAIAIFLLSRHQTVSTKLRDEIALLKQQRPTFAQLKEMPYLQNILREVLRLYPTTPLNNRSATKDTTLPLGGGPDGKSKVLVKKGQPVTYAVYAMHRRKDLYGEDAHEFRPERWNALRPGWSYLPFNGGPRTCLGQQFALTESAYMIVRLMQEYSQIESRDSMPFKEQLGLTLASRNGCWVALKK